MHVVLGITVCNLCRLLYRAVSGTCFLDGGVLECNLFHRRFVAVFCILYEIRGNHMHPLRSARPVPFVPVSVTHNALNALIAHGYTYASSSPESLTVPRTFVSHSVPVWNNFGDNVFDGVGLVSFKSRVDASLLEFAAVSFFVFHCFHFLHSMGWHCGVGVLRLIGFIHSKYID